MKKQPVIFALLLLLAVVFVQGCTEKADDPGNPVDRSSFLGTWNVSEKTVKRSNYTVTITADPISADGVFISNFANLGPTSTPAGAYISGSTITLDPDQVIKDIKINGSGKLTGSTMQWNYTLNTGAELFTVEATFSR